MAAHGGTSRLSREKAKIAQKRSTRQTGNSEQATDPFGGRANFRPTFLFCRPLPRHEPVAHLFRSSVCARCVACIVRTAPSAGADRPAPS
ncbi:hypothetical protein pneo_cds_742 [Pandoravirus neocaledonia]|uniref:Uncharacterized protein n=1 Tax=Pandoravirus neocaledonia TaxID=2107708 RepID=A0A2U7UD02_9VIRU|nr:hypothetical protein pneo_cds_742 [Pandoravirus neocaledonia]AVK76349.1 hypothetical protein pneo_cds_742 [Pandoravirus neocaledonia]